MRQIVNNKVLVYDDVTCILVNLGSAIRMVEGGHNLDVIKEVYEQLRRCHEGAPTALEVAQAYDNYLESVKRSYMKKILKK